MAREFLLVGKYRLATVQVFLASKPRLGVSSHGDSDDHFIADASGLPQALLVPRMLGHQRAFSVPVMGRPMITEDAHDAGLVNLVVSPGHAVVEAKKVAREICVLPADAVAISRKLLKLPTEELLRRL